MRLQVILLEVKTIIFYQIEVRKLQNYVAEKQGLTACFENFECFRPCAINVYVLVYPTLSQSSLRNQKGYYAITTTAYIKTYHCINN